MLHYVMFHAKIRFSLHAHCYSFCEFIINDAHIFLFFWYFLFISSLFSLFVHLIWSSFILDLQMVGWRVHCKPRKPTKYNNLFSFFKWRRTLPVCRNKLNIDGGANIFPEIISQSYFSERRFPNTFVPDNTQNQFSRGNIRDFILPKKKCYNQFWEFFWMDCSNKFTNFAKFSSKSRNFVQRFFYDQFLEYVQVYKMDDPFETNFQWFSERWIFREILLFLGSRGYRKMNFYCGDLLCAKFCSDYSEPNQTAPLKREKKTKQNKQSRARICNIYGTRAI